MNYQTMISDLTGMDVSNASLLDEPTAAAEAMMLAKRVSKNKSNVFFVHSNVFPQTLNILRSRAKPLGVEIEIGTKPDDTKDYFGSYIQFPAADGSIVNPSSHIDLIQSKGGLAIVGTDLLASVLIKPAGEYGADIVVGSAQRFGIPMGYGGPHAGFIAVKDQYKRSLPGRLIGLTVDQQGRPCYRLALQTREQHIRREKATSNICTAQALLAIMSGFYAIYHGPEGLRKIASRVNALTKQIASDLSGSGFKVLNEMYFDTLTIEVANADEIHEKSEAAKLNFAKVDDKHIRLSSVSYTHLTLPTICSV